MHVQWHCHINNVDHMLGNTLLLVINNCDCVVITALLKLRHVQGRSWEEGGSPYNPTGLRTLTLLTKAHTIWFSMKDRAT